MINREKAIRAVDSCFDYWLEQHRCLSPLELENVRQLKADVLALLKEHEPIEPTPYMDGLVQRYACGKCGKHLVHATWGRDNYCSKCGQEVKWND